MFRLTDESAKLRLFAATALDGAIVMTFDAALAALLPADFIRLVLIDRFAVAGVVVGFDFHFGKARQGSPAFLNRRASALAFASTSCRRYSTATGGFRPAKSGRRSRRAGPRKPPNCSVIRGS